MNEHENKASDTVAENRGTAKTEESPFQKGLMLVSAAWIASLGGLALLTAPDPTASPVYLPASVELTQAPQARNIAPATVSNSVNFIVRFKDVQEIETCLELFKEDPDGARNLFLGWSGKHAALDGMQLAETSYSGEMILSWATGDGHRPNRADIIAKQKELQAMPMVKYADPDYTAQIGGTTP